MDVPYRGKLRQWRVSATTVLLPFSGLKRRYVKVLQLLGHLLQSCFFIIQSPKLDERPWFCPMGSMTAYNKGQIILTCEIELCHIAKQGFSHFLVESLFYFTY